MQNDKQIFIEYGLDFDNNKYGFGRSAEIEYNDGTEVRTSQHIKFTKITSRYFRVWIGKIVFIIDSDYPHFYIHKKKRWNFKAVYGKGVV
ncbi:MAG: DUF3977 family protein [Pseudomonadota bacterium]|nr:DUF3977 family protein [Pseudomonadota bacterium]